MTQPDQQPTIDAHMHLWELPDPTYRALLDADPVPGVPPMSKLAQRYGVTDYLDATGTVPVRASVHIEAPWDPTVDPVGETRWLRTLPTERGVARRHVARCPFGTAQTDRIMHEQAAFDSVVGVRQHIGWHPDPALSPLPAPGITRSDAWRADASRARRLGLSVDLILFPWQADEVADLARSDPDLTLIINHCASPTGTTAAELTTWRDQIGTMAEPPNVFMKISSIGTYGGAASATTYQGIIDTIVETFGPHRAMFGSDFPVKMIDTPYPDVYDMFRSCTARYSESDRRALFFDTANRVYRVGL